MQVFQHILKHEVNRLEAPLGSRYFIIRRLYYGFVTEVLDPIMNSLVLSPRHYCMAILTYQTAESPEQTNKISP